ncbi:L-glutamine:2-deoxy-scyllo-inosose aminotransferase [Aerococcus viridans]|nr:L-glutamine:2-deoxy-scyllo-inosose aminotransferase [Aerococcus viridans]
MDLEEELSEMVGIDHALALASGTAAIHLALKLAGVGEGDVVLCQSLTFSASANPILYEKATPVFIDSETDGWNIDPGYLEEASRLVMQAGALARGGEIFVLDMGEPVKIAELARQMIWLSGHTEDEIEIVESGIRPGEKLYEELLADDENTEEQIFEKIFVGKVHSLPIHQVNAFIHSLEDLSKEELKEALVKFANNTY